MIKFENIEVVGWEHAIRGMRNPMNSWKISDSGLVRLNDDEYKMGYEPDYEFVIGNKDFELMMRLRNAGTDHRKFMRMINVYVDITAPLYWWKEFDTYKVGTVANSCSTMHKIHNKEFTLDDFSHEHLNDEYNEKENVFYNDEYSNTPEEILEFVIYALNEYRKLFLETGYKEYWWNMIQLLPSSYNQKRTVMLNYEVLANIYKSRKNHKLDEWSIGFIDLITALPYSKLITNENQ